MAEDKTGEVTIFNKPISRREFLKAAAAGIGGVVLGREIQRGMEWKIETEHAVFYPFYEDHALGVMLDPKILPQKLDIHWDEYGNYPKEKELQTTKYDIKPSSANEYISFYVWRTPPGDKIAKDNLRLLKSKGTIIAFGDISTPDDGLVVEINRVFREGEGAAIAGSYALGRIALKIADATPLKKITRRKFFHSAFLKLADIVAGYSLLNAGLVEGTPLLRDENSKHPEDTKAGKRLQERLLALSGHARPSDLVVFFRNLIFAHKLLYLSELQSKQLGRKINISYQLGAGHAGVEDLLILGKDVCEKLIQAYPTEVLSAIVETNQGFDDMTYTTLLIPTSPDDTNFGDGTNEDDWQEYKTIHDERLRIILKEKELTIDK